MRLRRLIPFVVAFSLVACDDDDPTGPDGRYLGYLRLGDLGPELAVTSAGSSIHITAHTYGLDGCHMRSGEDVVTEDGRIVVRVFDRVLEQQAGTGCGDEIVTIAHDVTVEVDEPGTWEVVVEGTDWSLGEPVPTSISEEVEVTPDSPLAAS